MIGQLVPISHSDWSKLITFPSLNKGPIGQMISYPLDVARKKMQLGHYSGRATVEVLRNIYREYGVVGGLYRGASINFIKAIPAASVTFYVYETLKQIFSNQRRENGFSENREVDQS